MVAVLRPTQNTQYHTVCRNVKIFIIKPGGTQSEHLALQA
jgi:hypothetical protein